MLYKVSTHALVYALYLCQIIALKDDAETLIWKQCKMKVDKEMNRIENAIPQINIDPPNGVGRLLYTNDGYFRGLC